MAEEHPCDECPHRGAAESIAEDAAKRALAEAFRFFGVNLNDFGDMERFRANLKFLDDQRTGSEQLKVRIKEGAWYLAGVAILGLIYLSWDIFKAGVVSLWGH